MIDHVGDERTKADLLAYAEGCDSEREMLSAFTQQPYATSMNESSLTSEVLAKWTTEEVQRAWLCNDWTPGSPDSDALAAEMIKRNLNF